MLKIDQFVAEQDKIMSEYYETIDANETKRFADHAKVKLNDLKEKQGHDLTTFVEKYGLAAF